MLKVDFSRVDDLQDFSPLPDGKYLCRLSEIEEAITRYGDDLWKLKFEVVKGEFTGRFIFDNMVLSKAALKRAKFICSKLGINVTGECELTPELLKSRRCYISVLTEGYEDAEGRIKKRNTVPFAGYEYAGDEEATEETSEPDDMPF